MRGGGRWRDGGIGRLTLASTTVHFSPVLLPSWVQISRRMPMYSFAMFSSLIDVPVIAVTAVHETLVPFPACVGGFVGEIGGLNWLPVKPLSAGTHELSIV